MNKTLKQLFFQFFFFLFLYLTFLLKASATLTEQEKCPAHFKTWMTNNHETIKDRALQDIVLPGSHHSGMYKADKCTTFGKSCNTKTQLYNIEDQLKCGIRLFDLRIYYDENSNEFYSGHFTNTGVFGHHGCFGEKLDKILSTINSFSQENPREILILDIALMGLDNPFPKNEIPKLTRLINDSLKNRMQGLNFWKTYEEILNQKRNILIGATKNNELLYHALNLQPKYSTYSHRENKNVIAGSIYKPWSNTNDHTFLQDDQQNKIFNIDINDKYIFYYTLQWIFTQNTYDAVSCIFENSQKNPSSITSIATGANAHIDNLLNIQNLYGIKFYAFITDNTDILSTYIALKLNKLKTGDIISNLYKNNPVDYDENFRARVALKNIPLFLFFTYLYWYSFPTLTLPKIKEL